MTSINIKKAQELLDQGMSRKEVANELGTTYNTIANLIGRKSLIEKYPSKYAIYAQNNSTYNRYCPITQHELSRVKGELKIGDELTAERDGVKGKFKIEKKYPFWCSLRNRKGQRTSATYVEIIIENFRERDVENG